MTNTEASTDGLIDNADLDWMTKVTGILTDLNPLAEIERDKIDGRESLAVRIGRARTVYIVGADYPHPDFGTYSVYHRGTTQKATARTNRELVEAILSVVL